VSKKPFRPAPLDGSSETGEEFLRKALAKWDYELAGRPPKYAEGKPRLVEIAFLAALLDHKAARSKDPGPVIRKAAALLDAVSQHLAFADLSTAGQGARLRKYADIHDGEGRAWKLNVPPPLRFSEACQAQWSKHKSPRELINLLKRVNFPERYLKAGGPITEAAYRLALKKDIERRKERESARKQKARAK
jgi:hypothetical protein